MSISGVIAVFTENDLRSDGISSLPTLAGDWVELTKADGSPSFSPNRPLLSKDKVRYVGEAVAMVIAKTEVAAQEGAEKVKVDYQVLDAVIEPVTLISPLTVRFPEEFSVCLIVTSALKLKVCCPKF